MTGIKDNRDFRFVMMNKSIFEEPPELNGITTTSEIAVFGALASYADNTSKKAFPSIQSIAERARVSRRTAITALSSLEEAGYISIEKRFSKGENLTNLYTLIQR